MQLTRRKPALTNPLRQGHRRWSIALLAVLAVALLVGMRPTPASAAVGLPLVLSGAALRLWAVGHLRKTRELTTSGPYAWIRHPLYLGTLLVGSGFVAIAGPVVAAVALPIGLAFFFGHYLPRKERTETERLEALYGERYRAYRAAVRAFVPSLHPWSPADSGSAAEPVRWKIDRVIDNGELGTALCVLLGLALVGAHLLWWRPDAAEKALRSSADPAAVGELAPGLEPRGELALGR